MEQLSCEQDEEAMVGFHPTPSAQKAKNITLEFMCKLLIYSNLEARVGIELKQVDFSAKIAHFYLLFKHYPGTTPDYPSTLLC